MIRLQKMFAWNNAVTYDGGHVINEYIATLEMETGVDDQNQQAVAYERLRWWIANVLSHSVMINENDAQVQNYLNTRQRVLMLPSDPVDHLVAMILYLKFNAIMEGRLILNEIRLSSEQGDHMTYIHSDELDGSINDDRGWWVDPGPHCHNDVPRSAHRKVVELNRKVAWEDLELGWDRTNNNTGTVIFPDFQKR
jgi:hypothetical protein